jgi:hypothetical protein
MSSIAREWLVDINGKLKTGIEESISLSSEGSHTFSQNNSSRHNETIQTNEQSAEISYNNNLCIFR